MFVRIVFLIILGAFWGMQPLIAQNQLDSTLQNSAEVIGTDSINQKLKDNHVGLATTVIKQESIVELPSLEEILTLHYQAAGKDILREVNSISIEGVEINSNQVEQQMFTEYYKRQRKARIESKVQGSMYTRAFNGQQAWYENKSKRKNQLLPLNQAAMLILQADIDGALYDYAAKEYGLHLEGIDYVGETLTYELVLTSNLGTTVSYFINAETFLIEKMTYDIPIVGDLVIHNEVIYKTYQVIGGMSFPFMTEIWVDGDKQSNLVYKKINLNPELTDAFFDFPQKK